MLRSEEKIAEMMGAMMETAVAELKWSNSSLYKPDQATILPGFCAIIRHSNKSKEKNNGR